MKNNKIKDRKPLYSTEELNRQIKVEINSFNRVLPVFDRSTKGEIKEAKNSYNKLKTKSKDLFNMQRKQLLAQLAKIELPNWNIVFKSN